MNNHSSSHEKLFTADWMTKEQLLFRKEAINWLTIALREKILPNNGLFDIEFLNHKQSEESIVAKISAEDMTYVVKMVPTDGVVEAEAAFLQAWERLGIRVPSVISLLPPTKQVPTSLLVMEYLNMPLLSSAVTSDELVKQGLAVEMGKTLAKLHQAKGHGFGRPIRHNVFQGRCDTFSEEMQQALFAKSIDVLVTKGLIDNKILPIAKKAVDLLAVDIDGKQPILGHCDFRPYNLLLTSSNQLVVLDPNTRITHPAMCLALTLVRAIVENTQCGDKEYNDILSGYRSIVPIQDEIIKGAILLRGLMTLYVWVIKRKEMQSTRLITFLNSIAKLI